MPPTASTTVPAPKVPTNGNGHTDPAAALFERKLTLSEQLNCRALLDELAAADAAIGQVLTGRLEAEAAVQAAKAAVDEAETLAALNAAPDGKNEPERKLQRERAVQEDPGYRDACAALRAAEAQLARCDADLDALKRQARRTERAIEYRTAALRFLGG